MKKQALVIVGSAFAGVALTVCIAATGTTTTPVAEGPSATPSPTSTNWRDGLVKCATPDATTMVEGCYWDEGPLPYMITDDGEMFYVDEETGARTYVEPEDEPWYVAPNVDADGTEHFEDGSWLAADGTGGCDPTGSCAALPPIPSTAVPTGNGGYFPDMVLPPCDMEDAEYNCYWDATKRGNKQGVSFIVWDGRVFYAEGE